MRLPRHALPDGKLDGGLRAIVCRTKIVGTRIEALTVPATPGIMLEWDISDPFRLAYQSNPPSRP